MKCDRKEFIQLAGCSKANLSTYIKRGHVVLDSDGKTIDTTNKINADFLKKRESMGKTSTPPTEVAPVLPDTFTVLKPTKKIKAAAEGATISRYNLELEKMKAELDKKLVDIELARQKLSVILGNNIPIDVVKQIISQLSTSIITNYKSFSDQQITEICHKHRIPDEDRVKFLDKNKKGLNNIHLKSVNDAQVQTKNAIGKTRKDESEQPEIPTED